MASAREQTGAQFAAVGVLDDARLELRHFRTAGLAPDARRAIGHLPRGRGVLGILIEDPRPLRIADVSRHPASYGFPRAHPRMRTFLGVPILVEGQPWGNLYLAGKAGGEQFTDEDESTAVALAESASVAIARDPARATRTIS